MRKRPSRPYRFAAVENEAIDCLPSILAVGLLTRLIRSKDGDDVTVESLTEEYDEGEKALAKAMRALVDRAFVVKFKIQRHRTETVIEDGCEVVKRGGSWYTTFSVDSIAFSAEDVAAMLEDIYAEGNVKSHRVEPTHLDPRKRETVPAPPPTPPKGGVGATCGNSGKPQDRPTPPSPGVGQGGAHIRKKTSCTYDCGETDAVSPRSGGDGRRPSDGSGVREAEGGSAASSNDHPSPEPQAKTSSSKAKHTRQQLELARAVRGYFPADMLNGWTNPKTGETIEPLPDVWELSQAILDALAGDVPAADRTVAQLGARIVQRWNHHGWAVKFYAGKIDTLVGAAVAMVRPLKPKDRYGCANPRCDAGKDVDTGEECATCPERIAARKAGRRAQQTAGEPESSQGTVPSQRPADGYLPPRECPCGDPISKTAEDPLCDQCRKDANEAEQTARLRAQLAAQYGTPDQVQAYTYGSAPF